MRAGYRPHVLVFLIPVAALLLAAAGACAADRVVLGEVFSGDG